MNAQTKIYDPADEVQTTLFQPEKKKTEKLSKQEIKCYRNQLQSIESFGSVDELFSGFNFMKAITFSYEIGFIDRISKQFDSADVILGADFMVRKDNKLSSLLADVLANGDEAGKSIKKYPNLVQKIKDESITFKTPPYVLDHRKLYLLKSIDGRTRVITASANMTKRAWDGTLREVYEYDDSLYGYESYLQDFEAAWENACNIPMSVVASKETDDPTKANAILKQVEETGRTIVLQQESEPIVLERIRAAIDHEKMRETYQVLVANAVTKRKDGLIQIIPATVEKVKKNHRINLQKMKVNNVVESYPELTFDLTAGTASLNGEQLDLNPPEEAVKSDINEILQLFANFDDFVGDSEKMKETHFKLMNAVFSSPFNAGLRCNASVKGIGTASLPMYLLIASSTANCGKTFMISALLKLMTGKDIVNNTKNSFKKGKQDKDSNSDKILQIQTVCKGVPVLIDEIDNRYIGYMEPTIKDVDSCENCFREHQPMVLFASNSVTDPKEIIRKRMVFLKLEGGLPSNIDTEAFKGKGNALKKRLGTGFYREYLRRMLDVVAEMTEYILYDESIPDDYYPDLMAVSSETILSILRDFGYDIPLYMRKLTWNNDYSVNATYIAEDAISEIRNMYKLHRNSFVIRRDTVIIELASDDKKRGDSWVNTLPTEMEARSLPGRDSFRISVNRRELEKRLGFKFRNSIFRKG